MSENKTTNNNTNTTEEQKREPYTFDWTKFEPFLATIAQRIITTEQLAKLLNARLKPAYQDYRGCFIEPAQNGAISVTLLFNQLSADKIVQYDDPDDRVGVAFMPVEALRAGGSNIAERSRALSNEMNSGRRFQLTQDAKDGLGRFISNDPKKINWKNISGEGYQKQGWSQEGYCYIKGMDIIKVLEIIFGSKNEAGDKIYYKPTIVSPVSNTQMVRPNNWVMSIQMMTDGSTRDLCTSMGIVSTGLFNCVQA